MAKVISQDPQTGFVTLQLDDGRTTVAPANVAYDAFPSVRAPEPEPGLGAVPAQSMQPDAGLLQPDFGPDAGPVPDLPLPSGPAVAPAPAPQAAPAPVPVAPAPVPPSPQMPAPTPVAPPLDERAAAKARMGNEAAANASFGASGLTNLYASHAVTPHGAFGMPREGGARTHEGVDYAYGQG